MIFLIITLYLLIIFLELPPLLSEGKKKEGWLYGILMFAALIISILIGMGVKIPSPSMPIQKAVSAILKKF